MSGPVSYTHLPNINVVCDLDLIGDIWKDRPEISHESVWILQEQYAGESLKEKIEKIQMCIGDS